MISRSDRTYSKDRIVSGHNTVETVNRGNRSESATVSRGEMTVGREPRLVDGRQIGPNSECDISGRCSVCGVILLARLNSRGDASAIERREQLGSKLERLFNRHVSETKCGSSPRNSAF